MTNQATDINSLPSQTFNLRTGDVFVGRLTENRGQLVRVVGKSRDGRRFVLEYKNAKRDGECNPITLFQRYLPMSRQDGVKAWGDDMGGVDISITLDPNTTEEATPRPGAKQKRRAPRASVEGHQTQVGLEGDPIPADDKPRRTRRLRSAPPPKSVAEALSSNPAATAKPEPSFRDRVIEMWLREDRSRVIRDDSWTVCGVPIPYTVDADGERSFDIAAIAETFGADVREVASDVFDSLQDNGFTDDRMHETSMFATGGNQMLLHVLDFIADRATSKTHSIETWKAALTTPPVIAEPPAPPVAGPAQEQVTTWTIDEDATDLFEIIVLFGRNVLATRSPFDGSVWAVGYYVADAFGINKPRLYGWLAKAGGDNAVKVPWTIKNEHRAVEKWMVRVSYLETHLHILVPSVLPVAQPEPPPAAIVPVLPATAEEPEVVEEGVSIPEGMMLATYNGVALAVPGGETGEARIRDITLGERLQLAQPRNIRTTIKSMREEGLLPCVLMRTRHVRIEKRGAIDGAEFRNVDEFWLTEEEALKVIMRSQSKVAYRIVDEMVSVYRAWRHGRLPSAIQSEQMNVIVQTMRDAVEISRASALMAQETRALLEEMRRAPAVPTADAEKVARDAKDAETLRRQRSNAAAKGAVTKDVNAVRSEVQDVLRPIIRRFFAERMVSADIRDPREAQRCLRPNEIMDHFNKFVEFNARRLTDEEQSAMATISEDPEYRHRIIHGLFNEASNFITGEKEIVDEAGVRKSVSVRPWYPKVSLAADPRQTKIPGTER